jgi:hypothetical protein
MRKLEIFIEILSQKEDLSGPQIDLDGFGLEIAIEIRF